MQQDTLAGTRRPGHIAIRTCIVCREKFPKSDLERYVWSTECPGRLVPDATGHAPGRGFYLCKAEKCRAQRAVLETARKKRRE